LLEDLIQSDSAKAEAVFEKPLLLYRLSLNIQIVHPKAYLAEQRILTLLEMKELFSDEELAGEIEDQKQRLIDYYPVQQKR